MSRGSSGEGETTCWRASTGTGGGKEAEGKYASQSASAVFSAAAEAESGWDGWDTSDSAGLVGEHDGAEMAGRERPESAGEESASAAERLEAEVVELGMEPTTPSGPGGRDERRA